MQRSIPSVYSPPGQRLALTWCCVADRRANSEGPPLSFSSQAFSTATRARTKVTLASSWSSNRYRCCVSPGTSQRQRMSQLVSAKLLIGARRAPSFFMRIQGDNIRTRSIWTSRSLDSTFFAPSFESRAVSALSKTKASSISNIWPTLSSRNHTVDTSVYAPVSDDPSITSRRSSPALADLSDLSLPTNIPSTAAKAVAAGYRPVQPLTLSTSLRVYRQLAKTQLTFLVTLTAMAGYALCPSALATSTSVMTLLALTSGTALCSASANSLNQLVESPYDAQMPRTKNRPLPSRSVTPLHAATFAAVCGSTGVAALAAVNPLTALLGVGNIVLYAGMYTPLKRVSISNTWLGSLVGGLPPLMGWAACTGSLNFTTDMPAWTLAALLFAWQFPHFNSLSHSLSKEYARGGYKMMSVTNPNLNKRTSLRYAIALLPICSLWLPWTGVVHWSYAYLSAPVNASMIYAAYGFWKQGTDKKARLCFWVSLIHLPAILLLAMACKTDVIEGLFSLLSGEGGEDSVEEERPAVAEQPSR